MRLDHVGVAVPDLAAALAPYRVLGATVGEPFAVEAQGVRACFVAAGGATVELLEPLGAEGPLAGFLRRHPGGGLHHLCHEVADLGAAVAALEALGARALGPPRPGAHGRDVVFLHPAALSGVLTELLQAPPGGARGRA